MASKIKRRVSVAEQFETLLSGHVPTRNQPTPSHFPRPAHGPIKSQLPTLKDVLGRGFLPQELPPPFNSLSLGKFAQSRGLTALPFDTSLQKTSRPELYNLARAGSFRRELAILNPIHFGMLVECLIANWKQISKLTRSKLSLTSPTPTTEGRAISRQFSLDI